MADLLVARISHARDWDALATPWNELLQKSQANSPFLAWEWLRPWWNVYGQGKELYVLTATDNDELVGLAPFYLEHWRELGLIPARRLRLLGAAFGGGDFLDCIVLPGKEAAVYKALVAYLLEQRDWDYMFLERLEASSRGHAFLMSACQRRGLRIRRGLGYSYPAMDLPDSFEAFMQSPGAAFKHAAAAQDATLSTDVFAAELDAWLCLLRDLHEEMVAAQGSGNAFSDHNKLMFYQQMAKNMRLADALCLFTLALNGKPAAMELGVLYDGAYYSLEWGCSRHGLEQGAQTALSLGVFKSLIGRARSYVSVKYEDPAALAWGCGCRPTLKAALYREGKSRFILGLKAGLEGLRALKVLFRSD